MVTYNLPPPYETQCFDYMSLGFVHEMECKQRCLQQQTMMHLGKIPYSVIITNRTADKVISYLDLEKQDFATKFRNLESGCHENCNMKPCVDGRFVTMTESKQSNRFIMMYIVPQQPSFMIETRPQMTVVEFITYLLSTVSTWTGLSIISMNPMNLWREIRNKLFKSQKQHKCRAFSSRNCLTRRVARLEERNHFLILMLTSRKL